MVSPSKIVKILEDLVRIPYYGLYGKSVSNELIIESDEEGAPHIYLYSLVDGSKKKLTSEPIYSTATPPDTPVNRVVYTRDVSRGKELQQIFYYDLTRNTEDKLVEMDPIRIFGLTDAIEYIAFTGATSKGVFLYKVKGHSLEELVKLPGFGIVYMARGSLIVGTGSLSGDPKTWDLMIYDLSSNELKTYHPKPETINKPLTIIDREIVFETNAFDPNRNVLVKLNIDTMELDELKFKHRDYEEIKPVEHSYCRYIDNEWFVIGRKEGRSKLFIDGKLVETPPGSLGGLVKLDNKIYMTYSSLKKPSTIIELDLGNGMYREIMGGKLPEEYRDSFGEVEFTYIKSSDGLEIPTYIVESRLAKKPGPTVVYVHGGPWSEVADSWRTMISALILTGFHVVAPNFRGSTGYGSEFMKLDIGDPGGGDLEDVAAASRYAVESGLANKLFIMGYSYGGYMTLWALTNKPDLYEAGVAGASVVDWEEMYELSDALFREFIKTLFNNKMDMLKERSPISKIKNLKKPLCIVHPQNDTRTPLKPVLRLMDKLLELGHSFEAHIVPDMGHAINTIDDALKILLPAILFLEKHK
ncbi:MAG: S9 family peptidase [Desulfurococcales archaeon ex4484_58]|nr:MAG: S9 family peptidase [Desulfurococcales archaeon ex4484_58]